MLFTNALRESELFELGHCFFILYPRYYCKAEPTLRPVCPLTVLKDGRILPFILWTLWPQEGQQVHNDSLSYINIDRLMKV